MRLITTTDPMQGESLASFFVRLTELNHYDSPRWICWLAGYSISNRILNANLLAKSIEDLFLLSQATGIDVALLFSMTFYPDDKIKGANTLTEGILVPMHAIHKSSTKLCPYCLSENSYIKKAWETSFYTVCAKHKSLLIDRCPSCDRKISIFRKSIVKCNCGFDFRDAKASIVQGLGLHLALQVEKMIQGNLFKNNLISYSSIEDLQLYDFSRLLFFTAGQLIGICDTTGKFIAQSTKNAELHPMLLEAYSVYEKWPHNFYKFLDRLQKQSNTSVRDTGVNKDFGSFYRSLFESFSEPSFDFVRKEFIKYLENHWDGGHIKRLKFLGSNANSKKYITKVEAMRLLGVRDSCINRYIDDNILKGITKNAGKRKLILIDINSATELKQKMDKGLSLKEAAFILGIGHESIVNLVVYGHLTTLKSPADGYTYWLICPESVDNLLTMIKNKIWKSAIDENVVSFNRAIRILSSQGYTIGEFIHMVQNDQIRPCTAIAANTGLHQYLFDKKDIENAIQRSVYAKRGDLLTVEEAANQTNIKYEVLSQWIDRGFIPLEKVKDGRKRLRYITKESIRIFQKDFILCSSLAKEFGTSSKRLLQVFARYGINPISGPTIDGTRQYLFRSDDVAFPLF